MKQVDARGLACPAPVLHTKSVLQEENPERIKVVVDNAASQQNVQRFLESQGYKADLVQDGDDYLVIGVNEIDATARPQPSSEQKKSVVTKIMVMCTTDRMGYGDDQLGLKLMVNFLRTVKEMGPELWRLVLVNNGVKLAVDGSEVLDDLKELENSGIKIMVCGTCLTHFHLLERKQIGETTNMLDIVTSMQLADKVVNI